MDLMKVLDQTVREIKREVNLKVLKVPEIEQKVLDATDNEPWGPHGTALSEIAQATKKYTECQMVMNVLWTRLGETGKDWRYVYKALTVIEYLIANGSERAVDDIVEHTFQISSLTGFEYVEPNGKDSGINVRKKAENIVALLNNKDKIQEVRNKATANREKYVGLSSTGMSYKSSSASYGSSNSQASNRYGGFSGRYDSGSYKDKDEDQFGEEKFEKFVPKSHQGASAERKTAGYGRTEKRFGSHGGEVQEKGGRTDEMKNKDQDLPSLGSSKESHQSNSNEYSAIAHQTASTTSNSLMPDDEDDFDPRGTTSKPAAGSSQQVDLFGDSLIGDLLDTPAPVPPQSSTVDSLSSVDNLFADADFVSAAKVETGGSSQTEPNVDLFAVGPASSAAGSSTMDFFASPDPVPAPATKSTSTGSSGLNSVDPFAAVPLNSFDQSDLFGAFTSSQADQSSSKPSQNPINSGITNELMGKSSAESKAHPKDSFQVKSGIWADSLSQGLIDLNITAPKKVNLADIGIVSGLSDESEKQKGPPTSYYMGSTMGMSSSFGRTSINPTSATGDDFFSSFNSSQYQFGGFQK